ncbi:MAG: magnesium/cobalt transporter CorA [Thermodesulfobacteriota bacterium]|nr:magnesium/cobalt transporter CorA [Thermodesulfobacteriota bacterium]
MTEKRISRRRKVGLPPGTLVHLGKKQVEESSIVLIGYDGSHLTERKVETLDEYRLAAASSTVSWINMAGLHDVQQLQQFGDVFGIHPLTLEDILNTGQRPRMEDYGDYIYVVLKMLHRDSDNQQIVSQQISLILGRDFVLSFEEVEGDVFDPVRDRLRSAKGRVRTLGADYLVYCLLDEIVDNYFVILEDVGEGIEFLQERVVGHPTPEVLSAIHRSKRDMILLRKSLWPVRELVGGLQKSESPLIAKSTGVFLRDLYEHSIQVLDIIETLRDTLSSSLDIYLSSMSNRMNEVMRVLTVIATLFIPLTFIVGIYGMNFEHMPELKWRFGYAGVWTVIVLTVVGMIMYFRRRKWF